jgi:hypothetical protein
MSMPDTVNRSDPRSVLAIVALFCVTVVLASVMLIGIGAVHVVHAAISAASALQ